MASWQATSAMFKEDDLILKPALDLYDNLGEMDGHEGRLRVNFQINPFPNLRWDFESLGKGWPKFDGTGFDGSISGYNFVLDDAIGVPTRAIGTPTSIHGFAFGGVAGKAWSGDKNEYPDKISFYLPNSRCLISTSEGSLFSDTYQLVYMEGQRPELSEVHPIQSRVGGYWELNLGNNIGAFIHCNDQSERWLKNRESQGTYLSAKGEIYYIRDSEDNENNLTKLEFEKALKKIDNLCWLLSFANGGYIGPLVVTASTYGDSIGEMALFRPYQTTPIELIGKSWVAPETDLGLFMECLPTFESMISSEPWKTVFDLIVIWYFQAIQPNSAQSSGKPWPTVANALGAALELLSVTILEDEFGEPTNKLAKKTQLEKLLQKIGVFNLDEDAKYAKVFIDVRNDATHPRKLQKYTDEERRLSLRYAKLWVEETLLWRLGYSSGYFRRIPGSKRFSFNPPRYDLSSRLPTW